MRRSLMPIPCTYLLGGIVLGILAPTVDSSLNSSVAPGVGVAAARDILTSTATGMIAFTGLVVSSVLVTVQFAAGQYSPRLVLWFRRDRLVKNAIGSFLAAPVFALVALRQIEVGRTSHRQDVTVVVALVLLIAAGILFLALLQRVIDGLRPRALYAAVTRVGLRSIRAVYPDRLGAHGDDRPGPSVIGEPASRPVVLRGKPGVVTSLDLDLMLRFAVETDAELELVCAVGEFVDRGQTVLRLHGEFEDDTYDSALLAAIDVSEERTIDQDPELAIRIIVDTAIRALSPAANDPATAVHAIDALEELIRELGRRDLETTFRSDSDGKPRLWWPSPDWSDLLELAFDELRSYGAGSVQVCRRLRAALEDLRSTTPPIRHALLDEHVRRLRASILLTFPEGSPDLPLALGTDRLGLGHSRPSVRVGD
jgi:uncharacterized membrane protein